MLDVRSSEECWALGDEALLREPIGRRGPRGGVIDRLQELADEMDVPVKTLRVYRGVAHAWPKKHRRKDVPFAVHSVLRSQPDKAELIRERNWTNAEARALVSERKLDKG